MKEKKQIYYTRTYRRLRNNISQSLLYLFLVVVPVLAIFILSIGNITKYISRLAVKVIGDVYTGIPMYIKEDVFSIFGKIEFIELPTVYPKISFVILNFIIVLIIALFLNTGKRKGKPISVYLTIMSVIHIINCIYFIFASNFFPYTSLQYSILYMKQQIGIWISFILISGLITGFLGVRGLFYRLATFFGITIYSLIYGAARYIVFLYVLQKFSILYMALLFFALGPFFDFLYLVSIYGIYMNKMIELYSLESGRGEWLWS